MALGYERGDTSIKCPYYVGSRDKAIICQGGLDPDGKVECRFRTMKKMREYRERYCRGVFGVCALCEMNDQAWNFERPK